MKIAFKKNGKSLTSKFIMWWTNSIYYHCELVFEDKTAFSSDIDSITKIGTRWITFDYDNYDVNQWEVYNLSINTNDEMKIKEWCKNEENCFYDFIGMLLTQMIPLSFQNPSWWFCSELCISAFQDNLNIFSKLTPHEVDPGELRELVKINFEV